MKFTDILNERADNLPWQKEIANKIKLAVSEGKFKWNDKIPTTYFLDTLGISEAELTDFCKNHDWNADKLSIGFEGNQDGGISLGKDPATLNDPSSDYFGKHTSTGEISDEIHGDM